MDRPTRATALVAMVKAPRARAGYRSVRRPMTSDANTATTVHSDTPVLNCPTVIPKSRTIWVWNSGMQFTNAV